ncbi:phage tail protein [Cronobacter turicensis]|nr:phage tail protein [Cronobacter turicensis]ELY4383704.1 phage tail protein [Cronobacter turicensis]
MADEPQKVVVQASRVDASILPPNFPLPYKLYVIQQGGDLEKVADATNGANQLAYEATLKNQDQDLEISTLNQKVSELRIEVDDHEIRITGNTDAISALSLRVNTAEGAISVIQTDLTSLTGRVSSAESSISGLQGDYVSRSVTTSQSLSSPLNVTTSYSVGGTKVIGTRNTGWTASTGTPNKGAFNADQAYVIGASYNATEIQALRDGLVQARQRIKALEDSDRGHGLIN